MNVDTKQKHTPFDEIIMRAWVAGWSDLLSGAMNDDNKREYARQAIAKYPECQAAPALLAACKALLAELKSQQRQRPIPERDGERFESVVSEARAAIAQAEKGTTDADV